MTYQPEADRLRAALRGLTEEAADPMRSWAAGIDVVELAETVRAGAARTQRRRRAAFAVTAALVPAIVFAWWALGDRTSGEASITPVVPAQQLPHAPTATPRPTLSSSVKPTPKTPTTASAPASSPASISTGQPLPAASSPSESSRTDTRVTPLRISLSVTSGRASADGTAFVAKFSVSWQGGAAPVYSVMIQEPGRIVRFETGVSNRCDGPIRPGHAAGEVTFSQPGPHHVIAVVKTEDCDGHIVRKTKTRVWTWSGALPPAEQTTASRQAPVPPASPSPSSQSTTAKPEPTPTPTPTP